MVIRQYNENDRLEWTKHIIQSTIYGINMPVIHSNVYELPPLPEEPEDDPEPDQPEPQPPTPPVTKSIYIGTLNLPKLGISSMSAITAEHIQSLQKLDDGAYNRKPVSTEQYDIIVVAVPTTRTVYIDDGLGNKTKFVTNYPDADGMPFCANGEITCEIDGQTYAVYGTLTAITGTNYIYID